MAEAPGVGRGASAGPAGAVQGEQCRWVMDWAPEGGDMDLRATSVLQQEESHLLEQCWGLDRAVVQLTKFVRQNQVSLNRVLLAEQKAR